MLILFFDLLKSYVNDKTKLQNNNFLNALLLYSTLLNRQ